MLPVELWKNIALQYTVCGHPSPKVYAVLSLVSCKFVIPTPQLQEYYLRKYVEDIRTEYRLTPSNRLHSPEYGNLPAVIWVTGDQEWYKNGLRHRDGDLPAVAAASNQEWWVNGKRHRDVDLPAVIIIDDTQQWYVNNQRHRMGDLPAIIYADGRQGWYINDIFIK